MNIGIVGHEAAKFTSKEEALAREIIRMLLSPPDAVLVSGHCHLGGIDIWAEEEAAILGCPMKIYPAETLHWENRPSGFLGTEVLDLAGFKTRNLMIASMSQIVHCIVVQDLPIQYQGMPFKNCYHCKGRIGPHIKSGGCWTAWKCPQHQWWIL